MISDISFIVIARNEEYAIKKCLDSIYAMQTINCEVICIDSNSNDNTLKVMKNYIRRIKNLKIIKCTGYLNAAVARNIGIKYATKNKLYFVDGDHELYFKFVKEALRRIQAKETDAIIGNLDETTYDSFYKSIKKSKRHRIHYKNKCYVNHSGGTFIVTREMVKKTGLWDERMIINEDFDYSLRIVRHGKLMAIPQLMAVHHTSEKKENYWHDYLKGYPTYSGMLIRKNIDKPKCLINGVLRYFWVGLIIWCVFIFAFLLVINNILPWKIDIYIFTTIYALDNILGVIKKKNIKWLNFSHYLNPPLIILGMLKMPKSKKQKTVIREI